MYPAFVKYINQVKLTFEALNILGHKQGILVNRNWDIKTYKKKTVETGNLIRLEWNIKITHVKDVNIPVFYCTIKSIFYCDVKKWVFS